MYIVDFHGLRENGIVDALHSAPVSANGNVQNKKLWFVKWPVVFVVILRAVRVGNVVGLVDVKLDFLFGPDKSVLVKFCFGGFQHLTRSVSV